MEQFPREEWAKGYISFYMEWKPYKREWQPTTVFLPAEFHRQRSLEGYSPWGHKESDMTEPLTHTHTHTSHPEDFHSENSILQNR